MNVFDTIHAVRPDVDPMPLVDRRMIRERLFGVGHDNGTRSFGARSASGAVVSTAPHGTRVPLRRRPSRTGSIMKMMAGVAAVALVGATAWWVLSGRDDVASETFVPTSPTTTPASTTPPTTEPPFVRTGVSRTAPLVLPVSLLPVDDASIAPAASDSSTLLLTAPDGTTMWMAEFDGDPASVEGLEVRQVGAVGVGVATNSDATSVTYQLLTPCGVVVLNDGTGAPLYRPEVVALFESMSLDGNATIDVSLPAGFSVLDFGEAQATYSAQFQVPVFAETRAARLVQIPDGSISQLMFGGRQLAPTTFLGGPAFVDAAPTDPALVSVYWQDGSTVFNVSSTELTFEDLESFVDRTEPITADGWTQRFDVPVPEALAPTSTCAPQPSFGPTLNP
jgi:hypothetical protein